AVVFVHALGVDAHASGFKLLQQAVQVLHAQVQHEGLLGVKVGAVALEGREHGGAGILLPYVAVLLVVDAEVFVVPLGQRLVVVGAEEESADAGDVSGHVSWFVRSKVGVNSFVPCNPTSPSSPSAWPTSPFRGTSTARCS